MSRFALLCVAFFGIAISLIPIGLRKTYAADEVQRPNIILLVTDDQRFDALGCMGNEVIQTPNIDALAKDGVLFRNMFCTTSICATSRATILSGQYARRHRIWNFGQSFSAEEFAHTFPMQLKASGYHVGFVGKWGVGGALPKNEYDHWAGFAGQGEYYVDGRKHMTWHLADQVQEFFDETPADKPFCLHVAFKAAHCQDGEGWQFRHAPEYKELYHDATVPPQKTATDENFAKLPKQIQQSEARVRWRRRFDGDKMYQENVKDYYRLLTGVDAVVGQIVDRLKKDGRADNTVIIFTSDNGFYLGDRGLAGKWFMHEESIRLPLVIYDPRLQKKQRGQTRDELVLTIDIAPTILNIAGIRPHKRMQGESVLPLVRGKSPAWREDFLYEHLFKHARIPMSEGVRATRWKYCRYHFGEEVHEELYDLERDPLEESNLAGEQEYADRLSELRRRWNVLIEENR